ncbi:MarR family transcriptional regulator [Bacillus tianshenii]|nr:MarR family transcriptional regulator [Bacillus tianshenii]
MEDTNQLFHEIFQTARYVKKEVDGTLKQYGLYHSQWAILHCLKKFGPMSQTAIWQYLNVEAPTVTRTVKRLEETGWVLRKSGADKRERVVALTDKAVEALPEVEAAVREFEGKMVRSLSDEQQDTLLILLRMIGQRNERGDGVNDTSGE